ncbi:MAG: hypothetical protein K5659_09875 [Lachnospiraceae bacterium]|nr:hypothetical protein [Lachnospiraceae bacterium]
MKVILSRKGFDSENGGTASPVMPDGAMLSMPIPSGDSVAFDYLGYKGKSYYKIWDELKPTHKKDLCCHLDPDIRMNNRCMPNVARPGHFLHELPDNWQPIFGQVNAAETHLENQGVSIGDIFLFFGCFRPTEEIDGVLKYKKGTKDAHMLFGYLQIGDIIRGEEVKKYSWHPHSRYYTPKTNNTMYIASESLVIDGDDLGLPGAGTFKYSDDLVLTMKGQTKSRWELPDYFKEVNISCHNKDSFKPEGYFQTMRIGQEFVVSESNKVTEWAKKTIVDNFDDTNTRL